MTDEGAVRRAFAPGRVNLIGDHTDYTGGLAVPMTIDLGTTAEFAPVPGSPEVELTSGAGSEVVCVRSRATAPPGPAGTSFARLAAAAVAATRPAVGGRVRVETTLPLGAGLSSSTSLEIALVLALGFRGSPLELALLCQAAEREATAVPGGLLDQLAICSAKQDHVLLLDFATRTVEPLRFPPGLDVVVVHSGSTRSLSASGYSERSAECARAEQEIGPLRAACPRDAASIADPVIRRRARHVVTENARARAFAGALRAGDGRGAGALMDESHASLRDDFEVSSPELEQAVAALRSHDGVLGSRLTGAGFGGCAVALALAGAVRPPLGQLAGWVVRPSGPARLF